MTLKAVFRADASLDIGTGHVMRCLTLADALRSEGADCHFICREHTCHLNDLIRRRGYEVHSLGLPPSFGASEPNFGPPGLVHRHWLGSSLEQDAQACTSILAKIHPDWLIVDHYALDARWESALRPYCGKIMAIDDLADRTHDCDLLLDQTFGRQSEDYRPLVPDNCVLLCGSDYALLRPEFAQWRPYSLARRQSPELRHVLITMGGVDRDNATGQILDALALGCLPGDCRISIVMGEYAPWLSQVREKAARQPWPTSVLVGVSNMARLMADSDLAIGAAGATSWERCCLGLPTILVVLAENQWPAARSLHAHGAVMLLGEVEAISLCLEKQLKSACRSITDIILKSSQTCAGTGAMVVMNQMKTHRVLHE